MRQYQATWNGTMTQARALVEAWKKEQEEKQRKEKMALWFTKNESVQEALAFGRKALEYKLIEK